MKTGECFYIDNDGALVLAVSYQDEFGVVTTIDEIIDLYFLSLNGEQ